MVDDLRARLDATTALLQPFVTGAQGDEIGTRFSALDSSAQFGAARTGGAQRGCPARRSDPRGCCRDHRLAITI
jgi:hypothetical protein